MKVECGDANPNGNIALKYKGGCGKELNIKDAYRCVGCGGWFHKECILKHFKLEKKHDIGRHEEREKIKQNIGLLRQYLNERTDTKLITNKELEEFLLANK